MKLRILLSYHYYKGADIDALLRCFPMQPEVFFDSGAYSAKSLGVEITVREYADWLKRWEGRYQVAACLDAIGDPKASAINQRELRAEGLNTIPVFHGGEPWDYLHRYLSEGYKYLGLGGMVRKMDPSHRLRWMVQAFRIARDAGAVYHGFGMTTLQALKDLPWYSVDSTSWGSAHRYGQLKLWDDNRCRWADVRVGDRAGVYKHASLIRAHGGDPAMFAVRGCGLAAPDKPQPKLADERYAMVALNLTAWLRLEAWLRKRHGAIELQGEEAGPKVFLASSGGDKARLETVGPKVFLAEGAEWNWTEMIVPALDRVQA